jgi:glucose dehydrogenase
MAMTREQLLAYAADAKRNGRIPFVDGEMYFVCNGPAWLPGQTWTLASYDAEMDVFYAGVGEQQVCRITDPDARAAIIAAMRDNRQEA